MNPQLSRRVALVMATDAVRRLNADDHLAFVHEVERAPDFEALPAWVQDIVLEGERGTIKAPKRVQ